MAAKGQRTDIEDKVHLIADRIVRGQSVRNSYTVLLSHIVKWATIFASTLTSIGLANPLLSILSGKGEGISVSQAFDSWQGLPKWLSLIGVALFVLISIALVIIKEGKIEEKAIQSLGAAEAFDRLEAQFLTYLEEKEPMQQLSTTHDLARALEMSFLQIIPKKGECKSQINDYKEKTINDFCRWWGPTPPSHERSEK